MTSVRLALAATLLGSAAGFATLGCYRERERFDVPSLTVTPSDSVVAPGDTLRGTVHATDGSGLSLVRVIAISLLDATGTRLDSIGQRFNVDDRRSFESSFAFPMTKTVPIGSVVRLEALAIDNQNFTVQIVDTVFVRARR